MTNRETNRSRLERAGTTEGEMMMANYTVNDRQAELLAAFNTAHHEGMLSEYNRPFGISRLALGGAGAALTGLIKRGFVRERQNIFYITEEGQIALAQHQSEAA